MAKKKYYVVAEGRKRGIFDDWESCKEQIEGFQGAVYKSFETYDEAVGAYKMPVDKFRANFYLKKVADGANVSPVAKPNVGKPIMKSISVDGAWNTSTGVVEYKGVMTDTKDLVFKMGPYQDGTNNIVEFLGIVHALAYCKQNSLYLPIYSDSRNAILWVKNKQHKSNHPRRNTNKQLFDLLDRAVDWLQKNTYSNQVLKWETDVWGENPADFGRK